ncbi:MAG: hypothetical protein ACP5NI_00665 [Acetobacteraceae bacterium]
MNAPHTEMLTGPLRRTLASLRTPAAPLPSLQHTSRQFHNRHYGWRYFLTPAAFREALAGLDPRDAARALAASGLLVARDAERMSWSIFVPGQGQLRLYRVADGAIGGEDAGAGPASQEA